MANQIIFLCNGNIVRSDNWDKFGKYSLAPGRAPKVVASLEFDLQCINITTHDRIKNVHGRNLDGQLISVNTQTQKVDPLAGRAEIGGLSISILDLPQTNYTSAYDLSNVTAYARSPAFVDRSEDFDFSFRFNIASAAQSQRILMLDNMFSYLVATNGSISIWRHSDGAGDTFPSLVVNYNEENRGRIIWDAAGNYTIELNGETGTGTIATYSSRTDYIEMGSSGGLYEVNGYIYDLVLEKNGLITNSWPCHDGSGSTMKDTTGSQDLTITTSSPLPTGWKDITLKSLTILLRNLIFPTSSPLPQAQTLAGIKIKVWVGYTDDLDDFVQIASSFVSQAELKNGKYLLKCADITRQLRQTIFDQKQFTLSASIDDGSASPQPPISLTSTTDAVMVEHTAAYSDAPSETVGYIQIQKTGEIIRYTGISASPSVLTGITRGVHGTIAQAVTVTGSDTTAWPNVKEFIYLEMPAPQMAYALITGYVLDSGSPQKTIPTHWHIGRPITDVNKSEWQDIGPDLFSSDTQGLVLRFAHLKRTDGKKFIEQEIFRLAGIFSPINTDGKMGLSRVNEALSEASSVMTLTRNHIIKHDQLRHKTKDVINQYSIKYQWDGDTYLRELLFTDADSITRNGAARTKEMAFKGLHNSIHTTQTIANLINSHLNRYRNPPQELKITINPYLDFIEANDLVRVSISNLQDFSLWSNLDRTFEVQQRSVNWLTGDVKLKLFGATGFASDPVYEPDIRLADAFYSSQGENIGARSPLIVDGAGHITANATLTGGTDMNAGANIFYYAGNLTVDPGVTLYIDDNVQLRVMGVLDVRGTISGVGRGRSGAADQNVVGNGLLYETYVGWPGYVGDTVSSDGIGSWSYASSVSGVSWDIIRWENCTWGSARTSGQETSVAINNLDAGDQTASPVPNAIQGIPDNLRGSSGGAGGGVYNNYLFANKILALGGTGGAGGSGLAIICRGLSFGPSGKIDLSGLNGSAGGSHTDVYGKTWYAGTGAGGGPGSLLVMLDGSSSTFPVISGHFVASTGSTIPNPAGTNAAYANYVQLFTWPQQSPLITGYNGFNEGYNEGYPTNITDSVDRSQSNVQVTYLPERPS